MKTDASLSCEALPALAVVANSNNNAFTRWCDPQTCLSGTFAGVGASSCEACAAGQYSVQDGAETCELCPLGTYVDIPGELN